jgi:hypothetical protein
MILRGDPAPDRPDFFDSEGEESEEAWPSSTR